MRGLGQVGGGRAEEHADDEAQRIGDREDAGEDREVRQRRVQQGAVVPVRGLGEEHLLRQEPVQQRHPRHRRGGDDRQHAGPRHRPDQPIQAAHVAGAGLVVDDSRRHEQRRLEQRMVHDVEDRRHDGTVATDTDQRRDQAEMADRRIGQQTLEVIAPQRDHRAKHKGRHPRTRDKPEPGRRLAHHGREPYQQEHARLHHGRRMQIGRYRGRRRHRVGQPEMERELRRFGEGSDQEQHQHRQVKRVFPDHVTRGQHLVEVVAADDLPQQQHRGQQAEAATRGDGQCHPRAIARGGAPVPIADQQE